jgi:hypothetical protein
MKRDLNVFEMAAEYRQLEALVDTEANYPEAELLGAWLAVEGDLNHKLENLGFAIRNREAILVGKQDAIKSMEASAVSLEKEIERLKKVALDLLHATNQKKAGGQFLTLSLVANPIKVDVEDASILPPEYLREIPAVAASTAPDKKKIADEIKAGVIVPGVKVVTSDRLAIR